MPHKQIRYLFVQSNPSQLDAPFYSELALLTQNEVLVVLMNDAGNQRMEVDPELGFVPVFPSLDTGYPVENVPRGFKGVIKLCRRIWGIKPQCVVVQDQPFWTKVIVSLFSRLNGIPVAMRSDKNFISATAHKGILLLVERFLMKCFFTILCPISPLTSAYYDWTNKNRIWQFPYCTNFQKFRRPLNYAKVRETVRKSFSIPDNSVVFLAVVKFVDRENPRAVVENFQQVVKYNSRSWLILVGEGPQFKDICRLVKELEIPNISFLGYVPYAELERYFFASDVFIHLAKCEPWGISAQDALASGLLLLTSDRVGTGMIHLTNALARFVVSLNNMDNIVERMKEIAFDRNRNICEEFRSAFESVTQRFMAESVAREWANRQIDN